MAVAEADLEQIVAYVKANIHDILVEAAPRSAVGSHDVLERVLRMEEELKHQREVMGRASPRSTSASKTSKGTSTSVSTASTSGSRT